MSDVTRSEEIIWYVSFYEHCEKEWDMLRTRVAPDECPVCGTLVDPIDYMEDNAPEIDWDFDGRKHSGLMYDY